MSETKKQELIPETKWFLNKYEPKLCIVGLSGKAGSGKNTMADSGAFNGYTQLAFASPIKKITKTMFHLEDKHLYDNVVKEQIILDDNGNPKWHIQGVPASPRLMFQWIGTILRSEVASDYFLKSMHEEIKKEIKKKLNTHYLWRPKYIKIVITDVRFPNEAEFIRKLGGSIIKIERPSIITTTKLTEHESEKDLPANLVDCVICNDGTISELKKKLKIGIH